MSYQQRIFCLLSNKIQFILQWFNNKIKSECYYICDIDIPDSEEDMSGDGKFYKTSFTHYSCVNCHLMTIKNLSADEKVEQVTMDKLKFVSYL